MLKPKDLLLLKVLTFSSFLCIAQDNLIDCQDSAFCVPGVMGMARTKGVVFEYERVSKFSIRSTSQQQQLNKEGQVNENNRINLKFKVPIWNKSNFKLMAGFQYFRENFKFKDFGIPESSLFKKLDNKPLKSIGVAVYIAKLWKGRRYFLLKAGINLNGDYNLEEFPKSKFLKFSAFPMLGWKANDKLSYGVGVAYSHNFGNPIIYPVFVYNKTFNDRWGLEMILPAKVKIRYGIKDHTYFYIGAELNGASYNISLKDSTVSNSETILLQKAEVRPAITMNKEIYNWIWFGITAGVRTNFDFSISESNTIKNDNILDSRLNSTFFFNVSIFLVPPRKFLK